MDTDQIIRELRVSSASGEFHETTLTARSLRSDPQRVPVSDALEAHLYRSDHDAADILRLRLEWDRGYCELLPSKGLTVGIFADRGWVPFWEPVRLGVLSPENDDLLGTVLVHGEPIASLRWIQNFSGCIELLGTSNWGMPVKDDTGKFDLPLHGEASHIPCGDIQVRAYDDAIIVSSAFTINDRWWDDKRTDIPRYERGVEVWRLSRAAIIEPARRSLHLVDEITNISDGSQSPDWGYHYQFHAEPGARLIIPSATVESRFAGEVEEGFREWKSSADASVREERGYIHKGLTVEEGPIGTRIVRGTAEYPNGPNTRFAMPAASYTLSWFSAGGLNSLEFALPENPEESLISVPWNGMGPEIGASPLDHDGNGDPTIKHPPLDPGETLTLYSHVTAEDAT